MPRFSAKVVRRSGKNEDVRYVTYNAANASTHAAISAVMAVPHVRGNPTDWTIAETVRCEEKVNRRKISAAQYITVITARLIARIIVDYAPGTLLPPRSVLAERLGVNGAPTEMDQAIKNAVARGYIEMRSQNYYVCPHSRWETVRGGVIQ